MVGSGGDGGSQGGCEWRSEAFVKIKKIYIFFFWGEGVGSGGVGLGGQGGWERRSEAFVKIQIFFLWVGASGWGGGSGWM